MQPLRALRGPQKFFFRVQKRAFLGCFLAVFWIFRPFSEIFSTSNFFLGKSSRFLTPKKNFRKIGQKLSYFWTQKVKKMSLECSQSGGCVLLAGCGFFLRIFKIDFSPPEGAPIHLKKKQVKCSNRVKFHIFFTENKKNLYFASSRRFLKKTPPKQEILGPEIHTNLTPKTGNRVF